MGSSPFLFGPLAVPNRYQVSPSLAMEGSWEYSTSPSTFSTSGVWAATLSPARTAAEQATARQIASKRGRKAKKNERKSRQFRGVLSKRLLSMLIGFILS